ncbi:MAG: hypothetical protein IH892_09350, partial [Planctomycetes bacterium]|nr:hypothetical protein [Planctomycetota bacterium]
MYALLWVTLAQHCMAYGYPIEGAGKVFHHHLGAAPHDPASLDNFLMTPDPPDGVILPPTWQARLDDLPSGADALLKSKKGFFRGLPDKEALAAAGLTQKKTASAESLKQEVDVFVSGTGGYHTYRLP